MSGVGCSLSVDRILQGLGIREAVEIDQAAALLDLLDESLQCRNVLHGVSEGWRDAMFSHCPLNIDAIIEIARGSSQQSCYNIAGFARIWRSVKPAFIKCYR